MPINILEVVKPVEHHVVVGKYAVVYKRAPHACNVLGLNWPESFDALVDSIVFLESANDTSTAYMVTCSFGSLWIADEGLTACDSFNDELKIDQVSELLRGVFVLVRQLVRVLPQVASQVVESILDVQDSMSCSLSSWMLGLLVRSDPILLQAILPRLSELFDAFKAVGFFVVDMSIMFLISNVLIIVITIFDRTVIFIECGI